ncbi:hypothetical protein COF09_31755 [Bacillus toyonensis]|nr:hypothetical protein COF09_31755 [Bacillus toyonensis]
MMKILQKVSIYMITSIIVMCSLNLVVAYADTNDLLDKAKVYDYKNNEMKTGVLYGISHLNRSSYWLTSPICLSEKQVEDDRYGFCGERRDQSKKPIYAWKFYDDSWKEGQEIDTEKTYFFQQYIWNEDKKEYEHVENKYAKLQRSSSLLNTIHYLVNKPYDSANPGLYRFKFLNVKNSSYVKIAFKGGNVDHNRFFIAGEMKENDRNTTFNSRVETVKYYSDSDIKNTFYEGEPELGLLNPQIRKEAECFILEPISIGDENL